jgi:uncharacterized repeat protein (TIGR01451 family)
VLVVALVLGFGAKAVLAQTGSTNVAPEVSIVNVTNTIYPLLLPTGGGPITFMYKVTNLGKVSLSDVSVVDTVCGNMSNELGDTNGNHLLDPDEEWIYTCSFVTAKTTAHTATVTAYANGLKAVA